MSATQPPLEAGLEARFEPTLNSTEPVPAGKFAKPAACVRAICAEHAVDQDGLLFLLDKSGHPNLKHATKYSFGTVAEAPKRSELEQLVKLLEDILALDEPVPVDVSSIFSKIAATARDVNAGIAFALCIWIVFGSILTGGNEIANNASPLIALAMLGSALLALALLEAAHIGAVALSTSDVTELAKSHPRVYALHRFIDTKEKLEHYLAARQLGVVMIVFVIAELTRTVELTTMPWTAISIPGFAAALLQIGVPGALLVLIIAQVAPQVVTARAPATMMNLAPMAGAFHVTRMIGRLGLAKPAHWLTAFFHTTERIPSAPAERYLVARHDVEKTAAVGVSREIHVGRDNTMTVTRATVVVEDEHTQIVTSAATVPMTPVNLQTKATLVRKENREPAVISQFDDSHTPGRIGTILHSTVAPRLGTFEVGDITEVTTTALFALELQEDFVLVDQPTKLVVIRAVVDHPSVPLPPALLTLTRKLDEVPYEMETVKPRPVEGDTTAIEFVAAVRYPDIGTTIRLSWGRETN